MKTVERLTCWRRRAGRLPCWSLNTSQRTHLAKIGAAFPNLQQSFSHHKRVERFMQQVLIGTGHDKSELVWNWDCNFSIWVFFHCCDYETGALLFGASRQRCGVFELFKCFTCTQTISNKTTFPPKTFFKSATKQQGGGKGGRVHFLVFFSRLPLAAVSSASFLVLKLTSLPRNAIYIF